MVKTFDSDEKVRQRSASMASGGAGKRHDCRDGGEPESDLWRRALLKIKLMFFNTLRSQS